ncbi:hypothetical protein FB451DRAFT_1402268 [Mycena latifolia]|nr:hypothetical protein FB451DRAFT_1402268 [Mycena latifolia]
MPLFPFFPSSPLLRDPPSSLPGTLHGTRRPLPPHNTFRTTHVSRYPTFKHHHCCSPLTPPFSCGTLRALPPPAGARASVAGDFDASRGNCDVARAAARATVTTGCNPRPPLNGRRLFGPERRVEYKYNDFIIAEGGAHVCLRCVGDTTARETCGTRRILPPRTTRHPTAKPRALQAHVASVLAERRAQIRLSNMPGDGADSPPPRADSAIRPLTLFGRPICTPVRIPDSTTRCYIPYILIMFTLPTVDSDRLNLSGMGT